MCSRSCETMHQLCRMESAVCDLLHVAGTCKPARDNLWMQLWRTHASLGGHLRLHTLLSRAQVQGRNPQQGGTLSGNSVAHTRKTLPLDASCPVLFGFQAPVSLQSTSEARPCIFKELRPAPIAKWTTVTLNGPELHRQRHFGLCSDWLSPPSLCICFG